MKNSAANATRNETQAKLLISLAATVLTFGYGCFTGCNHPIISIIKILSANYMISWVISSNIHIREQHKINIEQICQDYEAEIRDHTQKGIRLITFIKKHPDLYERYQEVLKDYKIKGLSDEPKASDYNLDDDLERYEYLAKKAAHLEFTLTHLKYFLQEDRELWAMFTKYVREEYSDVSPFCESSEIEYT